MTEPSKSVAFFDLDHTIIDTNSSWHWVQHEINNGRVGASMLLTALYWFTRYALGFGAGAERAGAEAAELYAGTRAGDLEAEVEAFFQREMAHRQRPGCVSAMAAHASRRERSSSARRRGSTPPEPRRGCSAWRARRRTSYRA